jgi:predicted nucleotidyltransferase
LPGSPRAPLPSSPRERSRFTSTVSRARGEERPDSDLDVLVEYDPTKKFSLLDLVAVKHLIEDDLGLAVDITTRTSLHPDIKEEIEDEAVRVY